ncbi:SIR2 family NAD-dependent protein deacylase [Clostridium saccharoperbutylacetonicum]
MSIESITEEIENKEIINEELSREFVLEKLFNSYNYGNLGMFIGAGFSKATINDNSSNKKALNWLELIKNVSENLGLDFPEDKNIIGISLPELATKLCIELQKKENISYLDAKIKFKNEICDISNWLPNEETVVEYREIFDIIDPHWIITTNYDLVLETILTGKCKSLSPFNYLSAPKGITPIYHIHGTRLDNDSIIITQDDYIPLFRPNEYRQSKLAMTIRESTTLVLGYGLGDMNVLSALDWSKNIYTQENEYPYEIIQVFWTSSPKENPYRDENGNIIIEIDDLKRFLEELANYLLLKKKEYKAKMDELENIIGRLKGDDEELVERFMNEEEFRSDLLRLVSEFEYEMIYTYIEFFTRCISRVSQEYAYVDFTKCNDCLKILLDVLINYEYKKMSPKLFKIIVEELDKVLNSVDISKPTAIKYANGYSWKATETWFNRRGQIPNEMIKQLKNYAEQNKLYRLSQFVCKL